MTDYEFISKHDSYQLSEQIAFEAIDPTPDLNWHFGQLDSILARLLGDGKKKWTPQDFMQGKKVVKLREQSPGEQMAIFGAIAAASQNR